MKILKKYYLQIKSKYHPSSQWKYKKKEGFFKNFHKLYNSKELFYTVQYWEEWSINIEIRKENTMHTFDISWMNKAIRKRECHMGVSAQQATKLLYCCPHSVQLLWGQFFQDRLYLEISLTKVSHMLVLVKWYRRNF